MNADRAIGSTVELLRSQHGARVAFIPAPRDPEEAKAIDAAAEQLARELAAQVTDMEPPR